MEECVQITISEYERLLDAWHWVECLEAAGVDNWDGISEAFAMAQEEPFNFEDSRNDINQ